MFGATPGPLVQGSAVRKQAEQATRQHPSMASAAVPASRFLPQAPALAPVNSGLWPVHSNKPFSPPRCFWSVSMITAIESKLGQWLLKPHLGD